MKFDWMLGRNGIKYLVYKYCSLCSTHHRVTANVMFRPRWRILLLFLKFSVFDIYIVEQWNGSSLKMFAKASWYHPCPLPLPFKNKNGREIETLFYSIFPNFHVCLVCQQIETKVADPLFLTTDKFRIPGWGEAWSRDSLVQTWRPCDPI